MTVGPWRAIQLRAYSSSIEELRGSINVKEDLSVDINTSFSIKGSVNQIKASCELLSIDGKVLFETSATPNGARGDALFTAKPGELELWYPVGYGKQTLYTLRVTISEEV